MSIKTYSIQQIIFTLILFLVFNCELEGRSLSNKVIDLSLYERKVFSQNGEDGVIDKIFKTIKTTNKFYVEFGTEDASECNTRLLREKHQWQGLLLDGSNENLAINLRKEFITAENITKLFIKYNVPKEFDLLSIDIDFNDFYVWHAISSTYKPRVVVIEYNSTHMPHEDKIVVYHPTQMWDVTNYFGASILALARLGKKHGYTLVYADNRGVNLFFIRSSILKDLDYKFKNAGNVKKIYRPPGYGSGPNGGHKADPQKRKFISSKEIMGYTEHKNLEL